MRSSLPGRVIQSIPHFQTWSSHTRCHPKSNAGVDQEHPGSRLQKSLTSLQRTSPERTPHPTPRSSLGHWRIKNGLSCESLFLSGREGLNLRLLAPHLMVNVSTSCYSVYCVHCVQNRAKKCPLLSLFPLYLHTNCT